MVEPLPDQVSVLILGGMTHLARPLLAFLLSGSVVGPSASASTGPPEGPSIKHIRVVDKFLVAGGASTTYVDPPTQAALQDPRVEYLQANLNMQETVSKMFDHPQGGSYDFVFDLTGEGILGTDFPEQFLLERTTKLASLLGREAARRKVRAYIRDVPPFLTIEPKEDAAKEGDVAKPKTARAYWWYEASRALADIEGLNLVLLRSAAIWGPHQYHGAAMPRIVVGEVYRFLNEEMRYLWGSDLRINTLHTQDWCHAAWVLAIWIARLGRAAADEQGGEVLPPVRMKDKGDAEREKDVEGICPRGKTPRAPVFNVVDDGNTTQGKLLDVVGEVFGIKTGFTNMAINTWAKLNLESVVDDINEKHAEASARMLAESNPPITITPISSYLDEETVAQRAVALDGSKMKKVLGWSPAVQLNSEGVREIIQEYKDAGVWANY